MERIDINDLIQEFEDHINLPGNHKILFSGPFGIGKSYFLDFCFKERKKKEINSVFISPVHYVVQDNNDIFNLIKADILFSLFEQKLIEFEPTYSDDSLLVLLSVLGNNSTEIAIQLLPLLSQIDALGERFSSSVALLNSLVTTIQSTSKSAKEKASKNLDKKTIQLNQFWDNIEQLKGTKHSQSIVNQVINEALNKFALKGESILIIDDLDRLDPDHVFRILNIFSSHTYNPKGADIFNFQKIIMVCDIENIKHMFAHRYGEKVDFEGYIDKFYSQEPFLFDNDAAINFYISQIETGLSKQGKNLFAFILKKAVATKNLTVRQLIKHRTFDDITIKNRIIFEIENVRLLHNGAKYLRLESDSLELIKIFYFLKRIWGTFQIVEEKISKMEKHDLTNFYMNDLREFATPLIWLHHLRTYKDREEFFYGFKKDEYGNFTSISFRETNFLSTMWELKIGGLQNIISGYVSVDYILGNAIFIPKNTTINNQERASSEGLIKNINESLRFMLNSDLFPFFR